jgi:hypothetical protein
MHKYSNYANYVKQQSNIKVQICEHYKIGHYDADLSSVLHEKRKKRIKILNLGSAASVRQTRLQY